MKRHPHTLALLGALVASACSGPTNNGDAARDAASEAASETSLEDRSTPPDDASPDGPAVDAEAPADGPGDAPVDTATPDTGDDSATLDAPVADEGPDAALDAALDTEAPDAARDATPDATVDATPDAPRADAPAGDVVGDARDAAVDAAPPPTLIWVGTAGNDMNPGTTMTSPVATLQTALSRLAGSGCSAANPCTVNVGIGTYVMNSTLVLAGGVTFRGGWDLRTGMQSGAIDSTRLESTAAVAIRATGLTEPATFNRFAIRARTAPASDTERSTYLAVIDNSTAVSFLNCRLAGGTAIAGPAPMTLTGNATCTQPRGGTGGYSASACPSVGGSDGAVVMPGSMPPAPGGPPGASNCTAVCLPRDYGTSNVTNGYDGTPGRAGAAGASPAREATAANVGSFSPTTLAFVPATASAGLVGVPGGGGGGGGQGGGKYFDSCVCSSMPDLVGGRGGNGGPGGCGGKGGVGGTQGGGSFVLVVRNSRVALTGTRIRLGTGGIGGRGGDGTQGQAAPAGTAGQLGDNANCGAASRYDAANGGQGGLGGAGGPGSGGNGGAGGPSIGVVLLGSTPLANIIDLVTMPTSPDYSFDPLPGGVDGGPAGNGGAARPMGPGGIVGNTGLMGLSVEVRSYPLP